MSRKKKEVENTPEVKVEKKVRKKVTEKVTKQAPEKPTKKEVKPAKKKVETKLPKVTKKAGKKDKKSSKEVKNETVKIMTEFLPEHGFNDEFTESIPGKLHASVGAKIPTVDYGNISLLVGLSATPKKNADMDLGFKQLFDRVKRELVIRKKVIENQYNRADDETSVMVEHLRLLEARVVELEAQLKGDKINGNITEDETEDHY